MGDVAKGCSSLHPNYREIIIKFVIPRDLRDQEVLHVLGKCLSEYVKEKSKIGYKEPIYINYEDIDCA